MYKSRFLYVGGKIVDQGWIFRSELCLTTEGNIHLLFFVGKVKGGPREVVGVLGYMLFVIN